jgi:hypothetical protein
VLSGCAVQKRETPRQHPIAVTTSYFGTQAYEELRADRHPVIVILGSDIAAILSKVELSTAPAVPAWLATAFPKTPGEPFGYGPDREASDCGCFHGNTSIWLQAFQGLSICHVQVTCKIR